MASCAVLKIGCNRTTSDAWIWAGRSVSTTSTPVIVRSLGLLVPVMTVNSQVAPMVTNLPRRNIQLNEVEVGEFQNVREKKKKNKIPNLAIVIRHRREGCGVCAVQTGTSGAKSLADNAQLQPPNDPAYSSSLLKGYHDLYTCT
ncbi:hypothetical protein quinque_013849 [Culex quinquefasciatus]